MICILILGTLKLLHSTPPSNPPVPTQVHIEDHSIVCSTANRIVGDLFMYQFRTAYWCTSNSDDCLCKRMCVCVFAGNLSSGMSSQRSSAQSSTSPSPMATMPAITTSYTSRNTSAMGGSRVSPHVSSACMKRGRGFFSFFFFSCSEGV